MIAFENVSKIYTRDGFRTIALDEVTFYVKPKEFISVVGQSGAGKSTLLKMLLAEESPTTGKIFLDNIDVQSLKKSELPILRRRIGAIFQDYRLLANRTAYENVAFAMEVSGRDKDEILNIVPQVLDLVGLMDRASNLPHELSGGERQRVAIARALVNHPDVIVADEPTGNLDPLNTWDVIHLLEKINELGTTIILATHDREIINNLGRRVISMDKGRIIRDDEKGKYII
jgi:cell division transport system ATP-binding protein